jgi:hypothetical protein
LQTHLLESCLLGIKTKQDLVQA